MDLIVKVLEDHGKKNNYHVVPTFFSNYFLLRILSKKQFETLENNMYTTYEFTTIGSYYNGENVALNKSKQEIISLNDPELLTKIAKCAKYKVNRFKKKIKTLKETLNKI